MKFKLTLNKFALIAFLLSFGMSVSGAPPATKEAHCCVLMGTVELIIPKTIDWLLDNQYVVRSVNQQIGTISFYKVAKWKGSGGNDHIVNLEGTILLRQGSNNTSIARILLNQEYFEAGSRGIASMDLQTDCDEPYYKSIFDGLRQSFESPGK
jgi:hypothetical protein